MRDEDLPPTGAPVPTPPERVWSHFQAFLDELPGPVRAAFLLHDVFGVRYVDIAFVLGASQQQCRDHVERAREHARAQRPYVGASL
ncbi:sigma factor-like helix-turn-helix DNA-binding protein [Lysobacter arvi]|uniref:Sigma factor-like helix-turn-helix DNA-binding protein n=1 Tax=Lysobacter arvi TaxID=3038776 RepID=A0ABU1C9Y5_9GAMM|nr:sigma factor-like helix-turn-helix DNA-binding protein [Lysobacter arvi]MDR0182001.1 sigma factor-like helix-turn-helix DNA-binding protein [Lysobacter arvi]